MNATIKDITNVLHGQLILGDPKAVVSGAAVDSRQVEPGILFFAFKGEKQDGHDFALNASRQGASGVVVTHLDWMKHDPNLTTAVIRVQEPIEALRFLGQHLRNSFKGPVVGITGSNGKTTTKQMVTRILQTLGPGLSTPGNYNSQIGLPLALSKLRPEYKWMVLEMGASAPGNIAALAEIARPTVGVITSIGPAHLETFGSIERVADTKWELMDSLPTDGTAIVPWAEPHLERLVRSFKKKIVYFGDSSSCPVRATAVEVGESTKFMLHIASQNAPVTLKLPGRHNVTNALAAAAAGWVLGCTFTQIVDGLENFEPPKMRMQIVPHASGAVLVNDAYNANPASMLVAVRSLVETYPTKKRVLVIGSMKELGSESEKYHFHIGVELAHFPLEKVFLVGPETKQILEGAISAGAPKEKFSLFETAADAAGAVKPYVQPNTVVFFKGSRSVQLEKVVELL